MIIQWKLSMPNNNAWNGRWSGESKFYGIIESVTGKARTAKYKKMIEDGGYWSYNFGDGWRAAVELTELTPEQARKNRKMLAGFCGYDWMVRSIKYDGAIYGPTQPKKEAAP